MENRRYTNTNTDKPFNRDKYQKSSDDKPYGERKFQPRDDRFRSRDDKYQPRDNRFQPRERVSQPRDERFQSRDERYPPRDNRFQPRDGRFERRDERFEKRDDRFQSRDNRFQPRNSNPRFDPKRRFPPKGKPVEPWKKPIVKPKIVSDMQVTDGKHAGKYLQSTTSPKVRPTMRKLRETMLKIVSRRVRGGRFLDLCAGSGAVGFEAISRGALLGTFVERSAKMCGFIRKNMENLGIKDGHAEIFEIEVEPFLKQMAKRRRFWDVVFLDPPYDTNYDDLLKYLSRGVCVKPKGILVIEHHAEMFFPEKMGVMARKRVIVEGDSALSFYERI